jgi:hypothetical protein
VNLYIFTAFIPASKKVLRQIAERPFYFPAPFDRKPELKTELADWLAMKSVKNFNWFGTVVIILREKKIAVKSFDSPL